MPVHIYIMAFENFSSILGKFSVSQRILALLMLLMTVVILGVAPGLIEALTLDAEEYRERMIYQEGRMMGFERDVDSLNRVLRANQAQCTDMMLMREREFWEMLEQLKRDAYGMRILHLETVQYPTNDSIMLSPLPERTEVFDPSPMIRRIERMQESLTKEADHPQEGS